MILATSSGLQAGVVDIRKIKVASLLDPAYCDVIVKRWEDFTGKKAVLHVA